MGGSKVQNEQEILRWFEEGRTYTWMVDEYRRKYGIETRISMFGNFRRRRGLTRRQTRNYDLLPWNLEEGHRWAYPAMMLRTEARRRDGKEISEIHEARLNSWLERMREDDTVVHYDPDTDQGFWYVPRRPGIDTDIIRVPDNPPARPAED